MPETHACAHDTCSCEVEAGQQFCSDHCSRAATAASSASSDAEEPCDCGHADCV